jgi:hypothetical protein
MQGLGQGLPGNSFLASLQRKFTRSSKSTLLEILLTRESTTFKAVKDQQDKCYIYYFEQPENWVSRQPCSGLCAGSMLGGTIFTDKSLSPLLFFKTNKQTKKEKKTVIDGDHV